MKFINETYKGQNSKLPTPKTSWDEKNKMLIISMSWGNLHIDKKIHSIISDYILSSQHDQEATSPFPKLSSLSPLQNNLRVALLLANEFIYRENNKEEYTTGSEVIIATKNHKEIAIASVGSGKVLIQKNHTKFPTTIYNIPDLSFELSKKQNLPPLPQKMLGIDPDVVPNILSFSANPGDQFYFIFAPVFQESYLQLNENFEYHSLLKSLKAQQKFNPFWLGNWKI